MALTAIRPRRSLLFMPGANFRALEKARELPADGLIFDLEDAVAPDAKDAAREAAKAGGSEGAAANDGDAITKALREANKQQ